VLMLYYVVYVALVMYSCSMVSVRMG
jgi:hypothetical protein